MSPEVEAAIRGGCPVVVATQCIEGATDREVYEVGANLGYRFTPTVSGTLDGSYVRTKDAATSGPTS